jgi:hypothetical protein
LWFQTAHSHPSPPESLFLARLALPESVHYRIFFPSREVLHECISPSSLPHGKLYSPRESHFDYYLLSEYGGYLPLLPETPNILDAAQHTIPTTSLVCHTPLKEEDRGTLLTHHPQEGSAVRTGRTKIASLEHVSPRPHFNPFYGYPIGPSPYSQTPATLPYLRYGRRRKRDLIRTLAALWWDKWRSRVSWTIFLLFAFFCARWWGRQRKRSVFFIRRGPSKRWMS